MRRDVVASVVAIVVFTALFGLAYPLVMTGVSQVVFPNKADGSVVERDGKAVGSTRIGQDFSKSPGYFQTRPSVTDYNPSGSYFNNQGPNQRIWPTSSRATSTRTSSARSRSRPA
jgi:K+-transporting ATPase ATPase C chain